LYVMFAAKHSNYIANLIDIKCLNMNGQKKHMDNKKKGED
jgi:hypothetical protein